MSEVCEIAESQAEAISSCPATEIIVVQVDPALGRSIVFIEFSPPVYTSTSAAVSSVVIDQYSILVNIAAAVSTATPSIDVNWIVSTDAEAASVLIAIFSPPVFTSTAAAISSVTHDNQPGVFISAANATSSATVNTVATKTLTSTAEAVSSIAEKGLDGSLVSAIVATSTVTPSRVVALTLASTAAATSTVWHSGTMQNLLLESAADFVSATFSQLAAQGLALSTAELVSTTMFRDPARLAWVVNTESTAVSWYDNYNFDSLTQTPTKVLAVGPEGIYEISGATDAGTIINASTVSGFQDFGTPQTKRVDNIYFGYTSAGQLSVTLETKESDHAASTFVLEQRDASAPRNSRITPAKGLRGRYWRLTTQNVAGADFQVNDVIIDVAVSPRRV